MSFPFKVLWYLDAAHLLWGLLAVLLGIADILTLVQTSPDGGFEVSLLAAPIWCGIPFTVAGGLGLLVSPYKPNVQEQTRRHWLCCVLNSVLFGPTMFITAMVDLFLGVQTSVPSDGQTSYEIGFIIISVLEIWCALGSVTIYCLYKAPRQVKEPTSGESRLSPLSLVGRCCAVCTSYCRGKWKKRPDKNSWITGDDTEMVITSSGAGHHDNESGVQPTPGPTKHSSVPKAAPAKCSSPPKAGPAKCSSPPKSGPAKRSSPPKSGPAKSSSPPKPAETTSPPSLLPQDASPEEKELLLEAQRLEEENARLQRQLKVKSLWTKVKKLQHNNRVLSQQLNNEEDEDSDSVMIKELLNVAPSSTQVHHGKLDVHDGKERQQQAALSDKSQHKQEGHGNSRATSKVKNNSTLEGPQNADKLETIDEIQHNSDGKAETNGPTREPAAGNKLQEADREKSDESQRNQDSNNQTRKPLGEEAQGVKDGKSDEQTTTEEADVQETQELSPEREEEIRLRLKEAQTFQDVKDIREAIKEFQNAGLEDFAGNLPAAQKQLQILELKAALDKAISCRRMADIGTVIGEIKNKGLQDAMSTDVARANKMLILIKQMDRLRQEVMNIKQSTIAEIRSYKNASEPVHKVMMATFLLLGENEKDIKDWSNLKALVSKTGKNALKQRVEHCDIGNISVAMATKVREMLLPFRLEEVRDHSAGAAAFFLWANGMADEVLEGAAQQPT